MPVSFNGPWRLEVITKKAGLKQRFRVTGSDDSDDTYEGKVGLVVDVSGDAWQVTMEFEQHGVWGESEVAVSSGLLSPVVAFRQLNAEDGVDTDYDDLVLHCTHLGPLFEVVQRPFALDRGSLTMLPDGIFDASQGIHYMGVTIRNTWEFDWPTPAGTSMMLGISNQGRAQLTASGISVVDIWTGNEQRALQQQVDPSGNPFVIVPKLARGEQTTVYFKLDVSNGVPSKPEPHFVAQSSNWDPHYDEPDRQVSQRIFVSRSHYDAATRELVCSVPEGTVHLRLLSVVVEPDRFADAVNPVFRHPCLQTTSSDARSTLRGSTAVSGDKSAGEKPCRHAKSNSMVTISKSLPEPGRGGFADGSGADDWCRVKPFVWLPIEFEYRVVPNTPYAGQFGPLAFGDPWWKVALAVAAILLGIASLVYDYVFACQDSKFIIGTLIKKSNRLTGSNVDAAIALLNGSRAIDLNVLDAQPDDRNNLQPIEGGLGGTAAIDRSDNGDRGIQDAVLNSAVFKSGARSATTSGIVKFLGYSTNIDGAFYTNQVQILALTDPDQPVSQHGDSGSLWIDMITRRPVALNFAGPEDDRGVYSISNPIREVVNLLDIHFNT